MHFSAIKLVKLVPPDVRFSGKKCIKSDFRWGSAPDPAGGANSAPPDPLAAYKRTYSKGRRGEGVKKGGEPKRRGGKRKGGKGRGIIMPGPPPIHISGYATDTTL